MSQANAQAQSSLWGLCFVQDTPEVAITRFPLVANDVLNEFQRKRSYCYPVQFLFMSGSTFKEQRYQVHPPSFEPGPYCRCSRASAALIEEGARTAKNFFSSDEGSSQEPNAYPEQGRQNLLPGSQKESVQEYIMKLLSGLVVKRNAILKKIITVEQPINLNLDSPLTIRLSYPAGLKSREYREQENDWMLKEGVVEPATSNWASLTVFVQSEDGKLSFCIDYRKLDRMAVPGI